MANQIPIKVMCDGSGNTCGLAQFTSSDSVAIAAGGTGLTSQGICEFVQPGLYAVGCKVTYLGICAGKADTGVGHDNTYVGYAAGTAVTTGCQHTLIGKDAGQAITTCSQAVSIGYHAGRAQTFGTQNTYVGWAAGSSATTADNNTAVGYLAGGNSICSNNTSIGTCAMVTNTQGQDNVAIGTKAGATQAAAGCNNVFVGSCVGAVALCSENTIVGAKAGIAQTSGVKNVFLGACVGYGVQGGANNVYLGHHAGLVNTSGNANVFIGNCAGAASTASCCLIIGNGTCDLIVGNFNNGIVRMNCVGIGSYTPDRALSVVSAMSIDSNASGTGSPQIAFRQATDKAFITYWDASDTLALTNASAAGLHFDPTNVRVGIGTAAPANVLHAYGAGNIVKIQGSGDSEASMVFTPASCNAWQMGPGVLTAGTFQIYENTAAAARLTIKEGGNVGIGTTAPEGNLHIFSGDSSASVHANVDELVVEGSGASGIQILSGSSAGGNVFFGDSGNCAAGSIQYDHGGPDFMSFYTNATLAVRIHNNQLFRVIGTAASPTSDDGAAGVAYFTGAASDSGIAVGSYASSPWDNWIQSQQENGTVSNIFLQPRGGLVHIGDSDAPADYLDVSIDSSGGRAARFTQKNSSGNILALEYSGVTPDNNTQNFLITSDGTAVRNYIYSDGDVWTADAGTLTSDERLKTNIVDASDKLADLMRLQVRNYEWTPEYHPTKVGEKKIGFIAQELETVFPALVSEHDIAPENSIVEQLYIADDDIPEGKAIGDVKVAAKDHEPTMRKAYKDAFAPILVKALQEVTTRLEAAEAKITSLESA